jgi:hypothetical protein
MPHRTAQPDGVDGSRPEWFDAFLADRGTRKPSPHTIKAYCQDFGAIAALVVGDPAALARMPLADITTDSMRVAFALYAETMRQHRFSGAGRPGMCCAPSSTPRS